MEKLHNKKGLHNYPIIIQSLSNHNLSGNPAARASDWQLHVQQQHLK
jgi:hypothetical protein